MATNRVQFQAGLSMTAFLQQYGTEAKCYRALYRMRWPQGFRCPACEGRPRSRFRRNGRVYYQCPSCRHQTTLTSGTLFAASKLPLTKWFLAMHLLTAGKTNLSALELMRQLGVCYATAWTLKHKIMQAMTEREESRQLHGFVQIDDAYRGGERNGGKPGRGSENKQPFVIAVSTDATLEHSTFAVIEPVRSFDNDSLRDWAARRLAPEAEAYTDGLGCFRRIEEAGHAHTVLVTGGGRAATQAQGARWVNVLLGNVKRASAAATMRFAKPSTRGAIWPRQRTVSIAAFTSPRCCRDCCARWCSASPVQSRPCALQGILMAELSRPHSTIKLRRRGAQHTALHRQPTT